MLSDSGPAGNAISSHHNLISVRSGRYDVSATCQEVANISRVLLDLLQHESEPVALRNSWRNCASQKHCEIHEVKTY